VVCGMGAAGGGMVWVQQSVFSLQECFLALTAQLD
jgi:hypothetical protein